jgi:hypothetical protein
MCDKTYEVCSCDESQHLLEALERAWAELPVSPRRADDIIRKALDRHHESVSEYIESER